MSFPENKNKGNIVKNIQQKLSIPPTFEAPGDNGEMNSAAVGSTSLSSDVAASSSSIKTHNAFGSTDGNVNNIINDDPYFFSPNLLVADTSSFDSFTTVNNEEGNDAETDKTNNTDISGTSNTTITEDNAKSGVDDKTDCKACSGDNFVKEGQVRGESGDDNSKSGSNNATTVDNREGCVLFVGNLPYNTPWQVLKDHFKARGNLNVRFADLVADNDGLPKGCALVTMASAADAKAAIEMYNNSSFDGRPIYVRYLEPGPRPTLVQREHMPRGYINSFITGNNNTVNNNDTPGCTFVSHNPRGRGGNNNNFKIGNNINRGFGNIDRGFGNINRGFGNNSFNQRDYNHKNFRNNDNNSNFNFNKRFNNNVGSYTSSSTSFSASNGSANNNGIITSNSNSKGSRGGYSSNSNNYHEGKFVQRYGHNNNNNNNFGFNKRGFIGDINTARDYTAQWANNGCDIALNNKSHSAGGGVITPEGINKGNGNNESNFQRQPYYYNNNNNNRRQYHYNNKFNNDINDNLVNFDNSNSTNSISNNNNNRANNVFGGAVRCIMNSINDGDVISLPKPRSQQADERGRRLFITNLPYECNAQALRKTFKQIGEVDRAEIIYSNGKPLGMGIVVLSAEEEALRAIREFHGVEMMGRPMNVRMDQRQ